MLVKEKFISQSLALNLFFLRIMKEHSIFLVAAFTCKDKNLINQANDFKNEFTTLLSHAISLSQGVLPFSVLTSNEFVTKYTLDAERATQAATGIFIDSNLTTMEYSLAPRMNRREILSLTDEVYMLNQHAINAVKMIIEFKARLLHDVLECRVFTNTYPLLIDHILREALFFKELLTRLQNGVQVDMKTDLLEQETFWNRIMSEHSFFIRGLLDPTEEELFNISNNFGKEFEDLRKESSEMDKYSIDLASQTGYTLKQTTKLRDFKAQATQGLLNCKIKSIIAPLLGDHVLREANHYLNLLKMYCEE